MSRMTYITALHQVLIELMQEDESVISIGDAWMMDPPTTGPNVKTVFGPNRVIPVPVSEMASGGAAIGAAIAGMRPIVHFGLASFMLNAWEQIVNEAANVRYMTGGQVSLPMVLYCCGGAGEDGAQHGFSPQGMLWNTPCLKLVLPSTPADIKGLFRTAVADPDPVVIVDHRHLYPIEGDVEETTAPIPFGRAAIRRPGSDVTIVATSRLVHRALEAAEALTAEGIDAEVIDPRTLVPLDEETILASVKKTRRLVVADESRLSCGAAAEIAARMGHRAFGELKAPIERVTTYDVPIPFSPILIRAVVPEAEEIVEAAKRTTRR